MSPRKAVVVDLNDGTDVDKEVIMIQSAIRGKIARKEVEVKRKNNQALEDFKDNEKEIVLI